MKLNSLFGFQAWVGTKTYIKLVLESLVFANLKDIPWECLKLKFKFLKFYSKRPKRRATRAVRPTKRSEFTEADGQVEGKIVFQLEKESQHETFKIRDENPWVTVEPNGAVRVKKRWDYEELGREKTIDFWVIITNSGAAGKNIARFNFFFSN